MGQAFPQIDVSVIIVNYNSFILLDECLKSLFDFNRNLSLEVIVVDNNSNEGNIESVLKNYPSVILIKNKNNLGFAAANNQGIKIANGKYILFLNNDTVFLDDAIAQAFNFAESQKKKLFIGCQLLNKDFSKQESVVEFPGLWNAVTENLFLYKIFEESSLFNKYYQNYIEYDSPQLVDVIKGAFMFCSANAVKMLHGFDERFFFYSEETDLCYRFKKLGGEIYFLPDVEIIHYGGEATDKNLWFKFKNQTTGKIQFYQKHFRGWKFNALLFVHLFGLFLRGIIYPLGGILMLKKSLFIKGYYFIKQMFVYPQNKFAE
jgi:hypothetical protein